MNEMHIPEKLACDLTVFTPEARKAHIELAMKLRKAVIGSEHSSDGGKVYFSTGTDSSELLAFAKGERRCCGFLNDVDVYRESASGKERVVLSLKTTEEGATAWTGAFFSLVQPPDARTLRSGLQVGTAKWGLPAVIAGVLCLSCVLPLFGALLVGHGLMPANWNLSEVSYLIIGIAAITMGFAVKRLRRRITGASQKNSCGC